MNTIPFARLVAGLFIGGALVVVGCKKPEEPITHIKQRYTVRYYLTDSIVDAEAQFTVNGHLFDTNATRVTANGVLSDGGWPYNWRFNRVTDIDFDFSVRGRTYSTAARLASIGGFSVSMDTLLTQGDTITFHWEGAALPDAANMPNGMGTGMYFELFRADGEALPNGDRYYSEAVTSYDQVANYEKTKNLAPGRYFLWVERTNGRMPLDEYESMESGSIAYTAVAYKYFTVE